MNVDRQDVARAAAWSLVAGLALALHVLLSASVAGPQLYGLLAVVGFGLLLPAIVLLHTRFTETRPFGALLATLAGTATAMSGAVALLLDDIEPATLFFLALWWWVSGKLMLETATFPRWLGVATAAASLAAFVAVFLDLFGARWPWSAARLGLASWLAILALLWWHDVRRQR